MQNRLLDFIQKLREEGVQVSPAELLDAMQGLCKIDLLDSVAVEAVLESALIKREVDLEVFRKLYNLFFLYGQTTGLHANLPGLGDMLSQLQLTPAQKEAIEKVLAKLLDRLSPLARYLLSTDPRRLEVLREMLEDLYGEDRDLADSPIFRMFRRPMRIKGFLFDDLRKIEEALQAEGLPGNVIQAMSEEFRRILTEMAKKIETAFPGDLHVKPERKVGEHYLMDRPFYNISENEAKEVQQILKNLSQYFYDVLSRKKHRENTGVPDIRRILRHNIKHDLLPLELFNRKRPYNQPELIVICDISSSVRHAARFMLIFVHQLQRAFRRVRSFLFAGDLGESTDLFKAHDLNDAIQLALTGKVVNPHLYTDYGSALEQFYHEHFNHVRSSTVVVVLGDGRNNYGPGQEWVLQEIRKKSRMLVWLNPESPLLWGTGDSLMHIYGHFCQVASECSTPRHLQNIMEKIAWAI
ncbi:MAG: VWA domain-containing protein [Nitrospirae bacterium]|nr:VWA domain-containing protein [Nitrospirota bacterium]